MISTQRRLVHRSRRAHDRLDLHLVDLGIEDPQPAAARAEHRVLLVDLLHARERLLELRQVVGALDPRALDLRAQVRQVRGGTRAAAGRAAGSSPAGPSSPRTGPRSPPAGTGAARSSAARRPSSSSAMIIARIFGWRSSAMNMCSVRHRPMPSAPSSRALTASSGVSAFARTPSRRSSSAHSSTRSKCSLTSGSTSGTSSSVTQPFVPSIAIRSPSSTFVPSTVIVLRLEVDRQRATRPPPPGGPSRAPPAPRARPCRPRR